MARHGLILAALCVCAAPTRAAMTCSTIPVVASTIRAQGLTELQADLLLQCTGGTPTPSGSALPAYQVLVVSNTAITSRQVPVPPPTTGDVNSPPPSTLQWNDALLLIDDPPPAAQVPCVPAGTAATCPAVAGASGQPNVFQGAQLQANAIVFQGVPIDAPGAGNTRTMRITNVRADATQIPVKPLPLEVQLTVQIFDSKGNALAVSNPTQVTGVPQPDFTFALRTVNDGAVAAANPALIVTPSMIPTGNAGGASSSVAFNVKFTEGYAGAFRRRNAGTSGSDPLFLASQAVPGAAFNTESGFFNSGFPETNNLNTAGLADCGTRLMVQFTDIPNNVFLWVSARDVSAGTSGYDALNPHAMLIYTDANGAGPFSQNHPAYGEFSQFQPFGNSVTLAWEVVAGDPTQIESISFTIELVGPNGVPDTGTAYAQATLAPVYPGVPVSNGSNTPEVQPVPSFEANPAVPAPAFSLVSSLAVSSVTALSAASYTPVMAPGSLGALFGTTLSSVTLTSTAPVPQLGGIAVNVTDNTGKQLPATLSLVSPSQINLLLDPGTAPGVALIGVTSVGQTIATGTVMIDTVAPGLFTADWSGAGLPAGTVEYSDASGHVISSASLAEYDPKLGWQAVPVNVTNGLAVLSLYGTGIRGRSSLSNVNLTVGGKPVAVNFAGAAGQAQGLDLVTAGPLPAALQGSGKAPVVLTVDGVTANQLSIQIQ